MGRRQLALTGIFFGLSGVAALVYQVTWQRILALASGAGIYSVAMIVGAFMAGLGVGNLIGGVISTRLSPRGALRAFAVLELGVAAFAAASCTIYYDWLYAKEIWLYSTSWRAALSHFLSLILPTSLMGMSLPFLTRALVLDARTASRTISFLYGINVLGAAVGAFLAPWVLIRHLGIRDAVSVGVLCNVVAGLGALFLRPGTSTPAGEPAPAMNRGESRGFTLWLLLYGLSGFCALSLEIVWFRVADVSVRSTAFTFGSVLAVYLLGLGAGSLAGGALAPRWDRPFRVFLLCQCALLIYSGVALVALAETPPHFPGYRWFFEYWETTRVFLLGRSPETSELLRLYALLPIGLFGPPTVLMGLAFAALQRAVQDDPRTSGRKVGFLQAANITGNIGGSLLTGLWAFDVWGTGGSMRSLMMGALFFAWLGAKSYGLKSVFGLLGVATLALIPAIPEGRELWLRLHGVEDDRALVREDATAVVAVKPDQSVWRVYVDGKSHSWVPFGGIHSWLGAVPALLHPSPRDVAVVGLGSGDTAWAAGSRADVRRIQVFEIAAPQLPLLKELSSRYDDPFLRSLLSDPRVHVTAADGRNALASDDRLHDVIVVDALRPTSAGSGNLYSVEFFRHCARKLKPGGLVSTWGATPRVRESFHAALQYVLHVRGGQILVGSTHPIPSNPREWHARLRAASRYLGPTISSEVAVCLEETEPAPASLPDPHNLNWDLFPRDEFLVPQR